MSGTSQWAMSEPIMTWSSAPNGLTEVLKAIDVIGSSASQPKQNRSANSVADVLGPVDAARRPLVEHVLGPRAGAG